MKEISKILVIILSLFLLTSCVKPVEVNVEKVEEEIVKIDDYNNQVNRADYVSLVGKDYIELLRNYVVRQKNLDNRIDDQDFDDFLNKVFVEALEEDYLYMHYTVADYKKYGIEKPELIIGELEYQEEPDNEELIEELIELQSFDYNALSYRQQYDYECLEYSLFETIAYSFYEKYDQLFTGKNDLLANVVTNFEEFVIYDEESIQDYLSLLESFNDYIDAALVYTKKQAENGLYLTNTSINYTRSYIKSFISRIDDNSLIKSFNKKINELDFIDDDLKTEYKQRNKKLIIEEVIPAFEKVKEELEQYRDKTSEEDNVLSKINKEYAELTYMLNVSSNASIEELFNFAKEGFDDVIALFNTAANDDSAANIYLDASRSIIDPFGQSYDKTLSFFANNYSKKYPDIGKLDYQISRLDSSSASNGVVAYYVPSPIDIENRNVIRVNPNLFGSDSIVEFAVLAHEGIPGHMYQYSYNRLHNINKFRNVISFLGYQEGYACYAQNEAFDLVEDLSKESIDILIFASFNDYLVESVIDIGVNCFEWTKDDVANYLDECGYNPSHASRIFNDVVDRNGVLVSYGIGYLYFSNLKEYAKAELKDKFDEVKYNDTILKNGQLPFNILKGAVQEYIEGGK